MTDLETIKAILQKREIEFDEVTSNAPSHVVRRPVATVLEFKNGVHKNVGGYRDFLVTLKFDETGALLTLGGWE